MKMFRNVKTKFKTIALMSDSFEVNSQLHQSSAFSHFLLYRYNVQCDKEMDEKESTIGRYAYAYGVD